MIYRLMPSPSRFENRQYPIWLWGSARRPFGWPDLRYYEFKLSFMVHSFWHHVMKQLRSRKNQWTVRKRICKASKVRHVVCNELDDESLAQSERSAKETFQKKHWPREILEARSTRHQPWFRAAIFSRGFLSRLARRTNWMRDYP